MKEKQLTSPSELLSRAEETIQRYEKDYKYLFQNNPLPLLIYDTDTFQFLEVNNAAIRQYGYNREEFKNMSIRDIRPPEDVHLLDNIKRTLAEGVSLFTGVFRHLRKNGTLIHVEITSYLIDYFGYKASFVLALDKTSQVNAAKQQDFERRDKEALINSTRDLIWSVGKDFKLIVANKAFTDTIHALSGKIMQPGDDVIIYESFPAELITFWQNVYNTALSGKPVEKEIYLPPMNEQEGVWAEITINPIYHDDEVIAIACYSRNVTERKLAEAQIRQSEAHLAEAQRLANLGSWNFDLKNNRLTWSDQLYTVFGTDKRTFRETHESFLHLIDAQDRDFVLQTSKHTQETGEPFIIEYRITTPDGEHRIIQEHGNSEKDAGGNVIRLYGTAQDITERRRVEKMVRESEHRYRTLFEQNLAGFYQSTLEGLILNCNEAFAKMLKYDSVKELLEINAAELYFSSDQRSRFINNLVDQKKLYNYEGILKCKDGTPLYFLENMSLQKDAITGEEYCDGILIDITERKLAEIQLQQSNERFINISKATFDAIWDWDIKTKLLYLGDSFKELFGYDVQEQPWCFKTWSDHIHPEDKDRVVTNRLDKIINHDQLSWKEDYRYIRADGSVAHVSDRGILLRNETGAYRMIGAMQDVTLLKLEDDARRKAEEKILLSEQRFKSFVQNGSDLLASLNDKGDYLYVSPTSKKILGYDPEFLVGRNSFEFIHPDDLQRTQAALQSLATSNYVDIAAFRFKNADGEWRWIETSVTNLMSDPAVRGLVANSRDVTDKKVADEKLELEKELKQKQITDAVFAAQEKERSEIGRELHDNVNQLLGAIRLYIDMAREDEVNRNALLTSSSNYALTAIEEIRKLSKTLITPSIKQIGFVDTIKDLTDGIMLVHPIKITITAKNLKEKEYSEKCKLNIFRIIQEQINNVLKHAKAKHIIIKIEEAAELLQLSFCDDGVGFDTKVRKQGVGLTNIRSRVELYNGTLKLASQPGKGTTLTITFNKSDLLTVGIPDMSLPNR